MSEFIVEPTQQAFWHRLICDAESRSHCVLDEQGESYLVFLLMRYLKRPDIVRSVLALQFLRAAEASGRQREIDMQDLGDQCLLYAGLFPGQASKRRVRLSYFVDLGQAAYTAVADGAASGASSLYRSLAETFVSLTSVLRAVRTNDSATTDRYLQAIELWSDSANTRVWEALARETDALPAPEMERRRH